MDARLANPLGRWMVVIAAASFAAFLIYGGARHEFAAHRGFSSNPDDWLPAAELEPSNADNWYHLARYRQLDFEHSDLPLAISYYQRAIALNPRSPYYKEDLASAFEMTGDTADAEKYFLEAKAAYPISGEIAWRYGNFLLRQQREAEAFAEIHRALLVSPKLIPLAISRCWRADPNFQELLAEVLPNTPDAYREALSFLTQAQEPAAAVEAWNRLQGLHSQLELKIAFPLIDLLLDQDRSDDAGRVWRQALEAAASSRQPGASESLVFDGGFESDLTGGGLGWRLAEIPAADFDYDASEKRSGSRSARIIFDGSQNLDYANLVQRVIVQPKTRYRFDGSLRTDQITTDSGMRFEIVDPKHTRDLDVLTPNETGTLPWTLEETTFTTGPQTHWIEIRLRRLPSQRLDNRLQGTVWVDDVALTPLGAK